ncbi:phosphoribosyltransferase [compost metagenome]
MPLSSITTPDQQKRLYIDPRMLPLMEGKRIALVDDVISSGTSIIAGLSLLAARGLQPVVIGAAMLQSDRWRDKVSASDAHWHDKVCGVFHTPVLSKTQDGWMA